MPSLPMPSLPRPVTPPSSPGLALWRRPAWSQQQGRLCKHATQAFAGAASGRTVGPEINASVETGGDRAGAWKRATSRLRETPGHTPGHHAIMPFAPVAHAHRQPLLAPQRRTDRRASGFVAADRDPQSRVGRHRVAQGQAAGSHNRSLLKLNRIAEVMR
jgi:hypothetical protein